MKGFSIGTYAAGVGIVIAAVTSSAPVSAQTGTGEAAPFAQGQALRLLSADRPAAGQLRLTFALENPTQQESVLTPDVFRGWQESRCAATLVTAHGESAVGQPVADQPATECIARSLGAHQGVQYRVVVGDPGGSRVDVYPGGALPFYDVKVTGDPTPAKDLITFERRAFEAKTRVQAGAATVKQGTKISVDLQTDVLFAFDKATLAAKANSSLDIAAKALKGQPGRKIAVVGHTDGQGSDAYNTSLSLKRAQAVKAALARRLGADWNFTVAGKGESDPALSETGVSGSNLKAAQQANRRVAVEVTK